MGGSNRIDNENFYTSERSNIVYNSSRSKNWVGLVGLIYPSDYMYTYALGVENNCYNGICEIWRGGVPSMGWLYNSEYSQWIISPGLQYGDSVYCINEAVYVIGGGAKNSLATRPALYLKSEVKITSGDGTKDNVYKLSM